MTLLLFRPPLSPLFREFAELLARETTLLGYGRISNADSLNMQSASRVVPRTQARVY